MIHSTSSLCNVPKHKGHSRITFSYHRQSDVKWTDGPREGSGRGGNLCGNVTFHTGKKPLWTRQSNGRSQDDQSLRVCAGLRCCSINPTTVVGELVLMPCFFVVQTGMDRWATLIIQVKLSVQTFLCRLITLATIISEMVLIPCFVVGQTEEGSARWSNGTSPAKSSVCTRFDHCPNYLSPVFTATSFSEHIKLRRLPYILLWHSLELSWVQ